MANDKHETHPAPTPTPTPTPRPRRAAAAVDPKAAAEAKEAQAASSIGAQIILDYNSEASLGARGGMAATIEENTMARDASLVAVGLDPVSPSGPPSGQPLEPEPPPTTRHQTISGQATRMSSLAAGAVTGDREPPPPTPPPL
jgi:hypothetical protein